MNRSTSRRQPIIHSSGTRRLDAHTRIIRRRDPGFDDTVHKIRNGDDDALHSVVDRAQCGDADAAVTAIWALLPRLAAVVINRLPVHEWQPAMDDYLTFTYLTLVDVNLAAPPVHLGDKIIARTRRRVERSNEAESLALHQPLTLAALATSGDNIADQALARVQLEALARDVKAGLLDPQAWGTLLHLRFVAEPGTASVRERKVASRARLRLQQWASQAA